jgi:Tol biopolymer transport system component
LGSDGEHSASRLAVAAPDADAPLPPLIFVRDHQLWRSDGTAAAPKQLTSLPREERAFYPALSPDGTQLAFVGRIPGQSTLYTMRPDGSALRPLWTPPQGTLEMAVWSPDQTAIYVGVEFLPPPKVVGGPQFHQIMRVDATTGSVTPLLSNAYHPTIASDGSGMAYVSYTDEGVQLNTASLDGSDITNVLNDSQFDDLYAPRFAPDDMQLVFSASGGPTTDVDGFPLARDAWDREEATNGHGHRSGWELWSIKRDGTGLRRLTSLLADTPLAAWAPDGTQLVVLSNTGIYLLDANGANARRIDQQSAGLGVAWLPTKAEREQP